MEANMHVKNEYERLKKLFEGMDETKIELADVLIWKASFLKVELDKLESQLKKQGVVQTSNKGNIRANPVYKVYLQSITSYQSIIKVLNGIFDGRLDGEDDEFDDFIKGLQGNG